MVRLIRVLNNERGVGLAMVLVVLVVSLVLVSGIVVIAQGESRQTIYQEEYMKSYYLARAGAESMVQTLMVMTDEDPGLLAEFATVKDVKQVVPDFESDGTIDVSVVIDDDVSTTQTEIEISSVGRYLNASASAKIIMSLDAFSGEYGSEYAIYSETSESYSSGVFVGDIVAPPGVSISVGANKLDESTVSTGVLAIPSRRIPSNVNGLSVDEELIIDNNSGYKSNSDIPEEINGSVKLSGDTYAFHINTGDEHSEIAGNQYFYYYDSDSDPDLEVISLTDSYSTANANKVSDGNELNPQLMDPQPIIVIEVYGSYTFDHVVITGEKPVLFIVKDEISNENNHVFSNLGDSPVMIYLANGAEVDFDKAAFIGKFDVRDENNTSVVLVNDDSISTPEDVADILNDFEKNRNCDLVR